MLALAPNQETRQANAAESAAARRLRRLRPGMAGLLLSLALLLIAAGAVSLVAVETAGEALGALEQERLVSELGWIAGLLAGALLLGSLLGATYLRQQARERSASETLARQQLLELRAQRDEALAAGQAATQILAQLGHELRTPLNAIAGFAQLLEMHAQDAPAAAPRQWVESMAEAASHMQGIVEDLQDAGQRGSARPRVQLQPLDVGTVIAEALRMVQQQADQAGVRLAGPSRNSSGLAALAMADPLRLRQVLLNLLSNAIKYGRRGGHVRVELQPGAQWVQLQVIDNGIGMDRSQLAHLFEPVSRQGRERSALHGSSTGSGIGLALVRQWMQLMKGGIRVESQVGIGTTVDLLLPSLADPVADTEERPHP